MSHTEQTIGFIGAGNMSLAIIRGLLDAGHSPSRIAAADPSEHQLQTLLDLSTDIFTSTDNVAVAGRSDAVVLATKPQHIVPVAGEIAGKSIPLIVSIAAGVKLSAIAEAFQEPQAVVRIMPNQPALLGLGMAGLVANAAVDEPGRNLANYIAEATGEAVWLDDESLMDGITAISGSGPAYFYLLLEMLEAGAREFGFSDQVARKLAVQTGIGATQLAAADAASLAELRRRVTSPGGTTEAAINSLEDGGIRAAFKQALEAARDKSIELGNK